MPEVRDPSIDQEVDDKSDTDIDKEVDEATRRGREMMDPVEREQLVEAQGTVDKIGAQLDNDIMGELAVDDVEVNQDNREPADRGDATAEKSKADDGKLKDDISKQERENRKKYRRIVMGVLIGLGVTAAGIVFLVRYLKANNPKPSEDFPQNALDAAKKIVDQFRAQPEAAFWEGIAKYVDEHAPGRQAQSMMMAYAKRLAGDTPKVTWVGVEKGDAIKTLLLARNAANKDSALYRTVATLKHGKDGSVDLSRGARADLCELAVATLWAREH